MTELDDVLTTDEAAEIAGKSQEAIRKACQRGTLHAKRVGDDYRGVWIMTRSDLEDWLAGLRLYEQRRTSAGRFRGPVVA